MSGDAANVFQLAEKNFITELRHALRELQAQSDSVRLKHKKAGLDEAMALRDVAPLIELLCDEVAGWHAN